MFKCETCGKNPATVHLTEIVGGQMHEKHLCESCASKEGVAGTQPAKALNEWLANFVMQHARGESANLACDVCGLTFGEFRQRGLLGCPACYEAFEKVLLPLVERAHESATHHTGKSPAKVDVADRRQYELLDLRRRLRQAVQTEDYEQAAQLRDRIQELEN